MAQNYRTSTNAKFTVVAVPSFMQMPDGTFAKDGFFVNRRTDNNVVLGKVTERYGIVQNTDLLDAVESAFTAKGLTDFKRSVIVVGEGEKMFARYEFRNHTKKLAVGDEVGLVLTAQNSFDGSLLASLLGGVLRLRCLNGQVGADKEVGLTKKHGSEIAVEFVDTALDLALSAFDKSIDLYNRLASVRISQAQGNYILTRLTQGKVMSDKIREGIAAIWEKPTYNEDGARHLYNLYNAVTEFTTHRVAGERFELANRVSANVMAHLNRASLKSDVFAKLVAPVAANN